MTKIAKLAPAQIVRAVMVKHGKRIIYNNKHKKIRTMKCYASGNPMLNDALVKHIKTELDNRNIPNHVTLNVTRGWGRTAGCSTTSILVHLHL